MIKIQEPKKLVRMPVKEYFEYLDNQPKREAYKNALAATGWLVSIISFLL